ncbi:hypothetical protein HDE_03681 [Halotydeus destructor]|nr:hypothetical protein HDE_03681 [Halotydeus destructor]
MILSLTSLVRVLLVLTLFDYLLLTSAEIKIAFSGIERWVASVRYIMPIVFGFVSTGLVLSKLEPLKAMFDREPSATGPKKLNRELFKLGLIYVINFALGTAYLVQLVYGRGLTKTTSLLFWWNAEHTNPLENAYSAVHLFLLRNGTQESWVMIGMLLYLYYHHFMVKSDLESLSLIRWQDETKSSSFNRSLHVIKLIQARHNEFESTFNAFPLLWFSALFMNFSAIMITNFLSSSHAHYGYAISELKDIVLLLYLIVRIDREKGSVLTAIQNVKLVLVRQQYECENVKDILLNNEIQRSLTNLKLGHTAFSLFPMDRSVILSFISSLITFSILFIQLAGVD